MITGQFRKAKNNGKDIVKIMGYPPCKGTHGLHFLGLDQLLFQELTFDKLFGICLIFLDKGLGSLLNFNSSSSLAFLKSSSRHFRSDISRITPTVPMYTFSPLVGFSR